MKASEVRKILGITSNNLKYLVRHGEIATTRLDNGRFNYSKSDVDDLANDPSKLEGLINTHTNRPKLSPLKEVNGRTVIYPLYFNIGEFSSEENDKLNQRIDDFIEMGNFIKGASLTLRLPDDNDTNFDKLTDFYKCNIHEDEMRKDETFAQYLTRKFDELQVKPVTHISIFLMSSSAILDGTFDIVRKQFKSLNIELLAVDDLVGESKRESKKLYKGES
ncbi:MerR family transcriptional regulator [Liquorilactobacillus hordei]|uniref:MerR family transcriptional regulator n=1 Tax=Liquorilactobacillus hordei TaxID=468911 RepID=UPI0039E9F193